MKIAIIPARAGSKRIKNKNIVDFYGKPLITYTIKTLVRSKVFDLIIVSSDSKKIQNISISAGAKILFTRPKYLSNDYVGTFDVINHSINSLKEMQIDPKYVCCIYPMSVMLEKNDLKNSFIELRNNNWNYVFSVTDFGHPPQRGFYLHNNKIKNLNKTINKSRTQDLRKIYHDAGQFYWGKTETWLKKKPIFSLKSYGFILPRSRAVDVDDMDDLKLLKKIFYFSFKKKKIFKS